MAFIMAILWTIVFVVDVVAYIAGATANWTLVFCPLIVLVFEKWIKCIDER